MLELAADEHAAFLQAIPTHATSPPPERAEEPQPALPAQNLPPFVGREQEQSELARLLAMPDCRLISLVGPGGIGKTRLALEIVAGQTLRFADGVTFVSLAAVGSPNQIVSAIGDTLNLAFAGQPDLMAYLISYLRERHMLLVLDNFDHLLDGVDLVSAILVGAPRVTILVTSRERLNLQTEWLFDIEGLSYPSAVQPGAAKLRRLADLADYSAVQLFVQRAVQVQPRSRLTASNLASIVRICQHPPDRGAGTCGWSLRRR